MTTKPRPVVVCLCGSTRFKAEFVEANFRETMAGRVVLSVGWFSHADKSYIPTEQEKADLDDLHKRKIDMADEVLVLNVPRPWCPECRMHCQEWEGRTGCCDAKAQVRGYVGASTQSEIDYARAAGKTVRFLYPHTETPS